MGKSINLSIGFIVADIAMANICLYLCGEACSEKFIQTTCLMMYLFYEKTMVNSYTFLVVPSVAIGTIFVA